MDWQRGIIDLECIQSDYLWEFARYRTFGKWPFKNNAKCLPTIMAGAGWYCTSSDPEDPSAQCAFCLKELNGWEPTDDPWEEHSKHSGQCAFVKLSKLEKDCTVQDMHNLLEARILKIYELQHQNNIKKLEELKAKVLDEIKKIENVK